MRNSRKNLAEAPNTGAWPGVPPVDTKFTPGPLTTTGEKWVTFTPEQVAELDKLDIYGAARGQKQFLKQGKNWTPGPNITQVMNQSAIALLNKFEQQNAATPTAQPTTQPPVQSNTQATPAANINSAVIEKVREIGKMYVAAGQRMPDSLMTFFRELQSQTQVKESNDTEVSQLVRIINLAGIK